MRVTIKDVADKVGVSTTTVSNVINDKGKVSESTRRAILEVIDDLNYRPAASAQRRYREVGKGIGLVIKEIHNPYFADLVVGAQLAAEAAGYELMVATSEGRSESEDRIVDLFIAQDIAGMAIDPLLDSETDLSHLFELKRRNIPFVLFQRVHGLRASLIQVDNATATRDAVKHLMDLGHEHIVHFSGPGYSMHSDERAEGFRQAFFDAQLLFRKELIVQVGARLEDGYRLGRQYFGGVAPEEVPTAVMCYNDLVALGLLRALLELNLRVPEDVSIVGFDDVLLCEYSQVPLTTLRVPTQEMGRSAVELLIRQMESDGTATLEQVVLQAELIVRASTAPVGR